MIKFEVTISQNRDGNVKMTLEGKGNVATGRESDLADRVVQAIHEVQSPNAFRIDNIDGTDSAIKVPINKNDALTVLAGQYDDGKFTDEEYLAEITKVMGSEAHHGH